MLHTSQDTKRQSADFLKLASIEMTAKQLDKLPVVAQHLPKGTNVFIALLDAGDVEGQIAIADAIQKAGFNAIPHVPARFVKDEADLDHRLAAFAKSGIRTILALGGGAPQPIGKFDAAIQLMRTGLFEKHGITRMGIAGHPEGNPDITKIHGEAVLFEALKAKQAWLKEKNIEGFIATQFLFDAEPLAVWARDLRAAGIDLPLYVGIPGPATIKTLVRYAAMCGVGHSARFIRKQALNITKLLTVSEPTEFIQQLAKLHFEKPELKVAGPHMYPFGGYDKLFAWWDGMK
ncbi:MAG: methylenetetrahydrofolate reductase [Alphaproteobacteria bacterium]|nr:methylenetetrahydrofolate reductase [Alphaproteobacteria bacterium]